MDMIFERDDKGLLHQVPMSLKDVSDAGRNINMLMTQKLYVLFTPAEEDVRKQQKAEAKAREDARLAGIAAREAANKAAADEAAKKAEELAKAQREAEDAKNNALAIALQEIARLSAKIDALTSSPPQS